MNIDKPKKDQISYLTLENKEIAAWLPANANIISTKIVSGDTIYIAFVDKTDYYTLLRAFNSLNDPENVMVSVDYEGDAHGLIEYLIQNRIS